MQEPITFSANEILTMYTALRKNVKKYREEKGLSQLQLSYAMGYKSVSLVSAAELAKDDKHFNLEHLYKISKILDIELSNLISNIH